MIKRLLGCVREYTTASVLTPIFMIGEVAMEVTIPFLMANLIDKGVTAGNMDYIVKMGLVLVMFAFAALAFGVLSGTFGARAAAGFAKNIRQDMYHNVQNLSFSNIDKLTGASIVTRLTTDVTNLQMAYMMVLRLAVRSPVMLILSLILSFTISGSLALIYLAAIPVLGAGLFLIIKNVHPIFEKIFRTYDKLNNFVQENVRGIRVVKSFVRENFEIGRFKDVSEQIYKDFTKAEKRIAFNMPLMQFCMYTCMILASWIGARLIVGGRLTTGELMSVITYAMQILMSLMLLSMVFVMIIISRASAERIVELLDEKPDIVNKENPVTTVKDGSVSFSDVSFSYAGDKNKLCLRDVTLDIAAGETVGIIGGTGSSKTSLVQLIPRLYDVTGGAVKVGGVDVRDYDIETLRDAVAVVLQKNVLFSGTIKENLRWGNENATDEEMRRACRLAQADEFIQSFSNGYDTHIEQGGANVSGGQKQRLCIARALLKNPKVLILDDSTSAVDTATDARIRKAFLEEIPHTTKFIISQRVSSVQDADKIIVMEGGKIDAVGTHDELLATNAIYSEVYHSQMKGGDFDEAI